MFLLKEFMMAVSNDNFIYSLYLTSCEINNQSRGAMVFNAAYCYVTICTQPLTGTRNLYQDIQMN